MTRGMRARTSSRRSDRRGFTLLEVLIAMAILALSFLAIGSADSAAILNGSRYYGLTTASLLVRTVVMDIEAEYQEDGFPENSLTGRPCELPKAFDRHFDCEYDLIALEFEPSELQSLVEQGVQNFMGGGDPGESPDAGKKKGKRGEGDRSDENDHPGEGGSHGLDLGQLSSMPGMSSLGNMDTGNFDATQLMILAPLMGPEGPAIQNMCNINLDAMIQRFVGMSAFFPMIVEQAAKRTRKLVVHLKWDFGPKAKRELTIETFIVGLPEEEMRKLREVENLKEAGQDLQNMMSPDGGVPPRSGGAARGRGAPRGKAGGTK